MTTLRKYEPDWPYGYQFADGRAVIMLEHQATTARWFFVEGENGLPEGPVQVAQVFCCAAPTEDQMPRLTGTVTATGVEIDDGLRALLRTEARMDPVRVRYNHKAFGWKVRVREVRDGDLIREDVQKLIDKLEIMCREADRDMPERRGIYQALCEIRDVTGIVWSASSSPIFHVSPDPQNGGIAR